MSDNYFESIDSFDRKDTENLDRIIEHLKENTPYINWTTRWHDHDSGSYITIEVPVEQERDANKIYELYNSGEDISKYVLISEYPGIYIFRDNIWKLEKDIEDYISLYEFIDYTLATPTSVLDKLQTLVEVLPELYKKTWELPDVGEISFNQSNIVIMNGDSEIFNEQQVIKYYIDYHIDLLMISELLEEILENMNYNYFCDGPDSVGQSEVASMLSEWKYTFLEHDGWGEKLLKLILLIHQSIQKIELSRKVWK